MPLPSQPLPTIGLSESTEDPKTRAALAELQAIVSALDLSNLATSLANTFLKLSTGADKKLAFGTGTLVFPGGGPLSNALQIAHGLGGTPGLVIATAGVYDDAGTRGPVAVSTVSSLTDGTNIGLRGRAVDGSVLSGSIGLYWLAIR